MTTKDDMQLIREQLDGLSKTVQSDENFKVNKADYLETLNSLKNRLMEAQKVPDSLMGTSTGRTSSKNPNLHAIPRNNPGVLGPVGETGKTTGPAIAKHPLPNRRAAIQHTRKLNERSNDS